MQPSPDLPNIVEHRVEVLVTIDNREIEKGAPFILVRNERNEFALAQTIGPDTRMLRRFVPLNGAVDLAMRILGGEKAVEDHAGARYAIAAALVGVYASATINIERAAASRTAASASLDDAVAKPAAAPPAPVSRPGPSPKVLAAEARARGYTGDMCVNCGNFTTKRNGSCLACDTCGQTTGCS